MTTKKQKRAKSQAKAIAAGIQLAADRANRARIWADRERKRKAFEKADLMHQTAKAGMQKIKGEKK